MFVGFLQWWYGAGLKARANEAGERLARVNDFFSVELLLKTLFSPFRQLAIGRVRGPLEVQLRALVDNVIGRLIGAGVRSAMIVAAGVAAVGAVLFGGVVIVGWLALPVLPVIGAVLALAGVRA